MSPTPAEYAHYPGSKARRMIAGITMARTSEEMHANADALAAYIADLARQRDELRAQVMTLEAAGKPTA